MAIRTYLKSTIAAAALMAIWQAPVHADLSSQNLPTYHITVCGGFDAPQPGSPCYVHNDDGPPPASAIASLTQDSFNEFFSEERFPPLPPGLHYSFTIEGGSKSGYLYGHVTTDSGFDAEFVSFEGEILAAQDFPDLLGFRTTSINDNGYVIGYNGQIWFSSDPSGPDIHNSAQWNLDEASQEIVNQFGGPVFFEDNDTRFLALDDLNRISAIGPPGTYLLTPIGLLAVPEPDSLSLLASALGMLLWLRWRDWRHS